MWLFCTLGSKLIQPHVNRKPDFLFQVVGLTTIAKHCYTPAADYSLIGNIYQVFLRYLTCQLNLPPKLPKIFLKQHHIIEQLYLLITHILIVDHVNAV